MYKYIILILSLGIFVPAKSAAQPCDPCDLLILNARIIDGSGNPAFASDILIHNGVIVALEEQDPAEINARTLIDAEGRVAAPGFIDMHAHGNPLSTPQFRNFLSMGVTTITTGQDGRSVQTEQPGKWMDRVDETGTGPNILHFQGHATLRLLADAPLESDLDPGIIRQMTGFMEEAMQQGSFGLTTGLEYEPGIFADLNELVEVAKPVAEYDGLLMSHMRSEDDDKIEESIRELIDQGKGAGADVHISHLKIVYTNIPARADEVLSLINDARDEEIEITADLYPYTASYTGISIVFPEWARPPHDYEKVVSQRRDELATYLKNRVDMRNGPEATLFGTDPWTGMTLAEVADSLGKPFEDVLIDVIGPGGASAAYFVMNEEVMKRFLQDSYVMVSSDGSPTMQHPRGYGSFAKIIRKYVREENLLTLEEAIHKMSGLPASTLGLDNPDRVENPRGFLREGYAADLVLFHPEQVQDKATFDQPHRLAEGFDWVVVNGTVSIENGQFRNENSGKLIRRSTDR